MEAHSTTLFPDPAALDGVGPPIFEPKDYRTSPTLGKALSSGVFAAAGADPELSNLLSKLFVAFGVAALLGTMVGTELEPGLSSPEASPAVPVADRATGPVRLVL